MLCIKRHEETGFKIAATWCIKVHKWHSFSSSHSRYINFIFSMLTGWVDSCIGEQLSRIFSSSGNHCFPSCLSQKEYNFNKNPRFEQRFYLLEVTTVGKIQFNSN